MTRRNFDESAVIRVESGKKTATAVPQSLDAAPFVDDLIFTVLSGAAPAADSPVDGALRTPWNAGTRR